MHDITVVIPVYRAENSLQELTHRLVATLEKIAARFEIVFVEDCGEDRSWDIIAVLARTDPRIRGIKLNRNYGQHNALLCGIRAARHPIIVTLDDDLQHPPEEIPKLIDALSLGTDVVYGAPQAEQHGLLRDLASRLTKLALSSVMGAATARNVSAFRAFRTHLREGFKDYRGPYVSIDVLLTWCTSRFAAVPVKHLPRAAGESGYTVRMLVAHAFNLMTGFSTLPLQIASLVGFAFVLFGILIMIYVAGVFLFVGRAVPGFAFLASLVVIFSGAQLFALGIFGEYLARMHFRSMDRPAYLVGEEISARETSELS
jgi:undecaprenyl-phosphate 4-deoxy-4-formamido-L-arabinose transferase